MTKTSSTLTSLAASPSNGNYWLWRTTTYYLTVPITCTQTRIHHTQSLHYDKLLKRSSLRHIVTTNFAATIYRGDISFCFGRYRCNKVSLERYLDEISWRLYRYLDLMFGNPCDVSLIYRREIARTKCDIRRLSFALLLHSTVDQTGKLFFPEQIANLKL